jgi:hypothetical protein
MDSAQGMIADAELAVIVGDDDGVANEPVMADGTPDACFPQDAHRVPVENVDALVRQMLQKWDLVAEALWLE